MSFICKYFKKKAIKSHILNKQSKTLCIIVGHTGAKPGAWSEHLMSSEYYYNKRFAKLIEKQVLMLNLQCEIIFRDNIGILGAYKKALNFDPRIIIELHFNSFNGLVSGSEVLTSTKDDLKIYDEIEFSTNLLNAFSNILEINNRGIKDLTARGERGFVNVSQTSNVPSILLEPFFGDNRSDCEIFNKNIEKIAQSIAYEFQAFVDDNHKSNPS